MSHLPSCRVLTPGRCGIRTGSLAGILLIVASAVLCGCGRSAEEDGRVTLTFWHSFVSATIPSVEALVRDFEAEHPGIRVNAQYIPTGDGLVQKLVTAVRSGTAPDIAWIHADFLDKLVLARAIYPIDEIAGGADGLAEAEMADFFPGLLSTASWRDTLYALPMEATSLALFYNRDLFRQAGLDPERPPTTWEELALVARQLTRDTDGDGRTDQFGFLVPVFPASGSLNIWMVLQFAPYVWQAGGRLISDDQSHVLFDREPAIRALTFWKQLYDDLDGKALTVTHDLAFASQRAAMVMDGPWDLPRFRQLDQFEWGVAPLPEGPVGSATYLAGEHLAIFRQTRHPDEAWTFLKWVVRADVQARFAISSGYLPVRRSTLGLPEFIAHLERDAAYRSFVEQMSVARTRQPLDYHRVEVNRHIAEAIEQAAVGNVDPGVALATAAEKSNLLLAQTPYGSAE